MKTPSSIEPLEARIAPASLNAAGNLLTYTDIDGDLVKVSFTGGAKLEASDFIFSTGSASVGGDTATKQSLTSIDLANQTGGGFNLVATPQTILGVRQGDSHANIDIIKGFAVNLGTINVDGDVRSFSAGGGVGIGLKSFTALSLGLGSAASTENTFYNVVSFKVKTDVLNETLHFNGGVKTLSIGGDVTERGGGVSTQIIIDGDAGSLKIGGSVIGRAGGKGNINVQGSVGTFSIGGSIRGGDVGVGFDSAQVQVIGKVNTFSLGGDLLGGAGRGGGFLSLGSVGSAKIGGSIIGANNALSSGDFQVSGDAKSITIAGSLRGGDATSGTVDRNGAVIIFGNLGTLVLGHDFSGGRANGGTLATSSSTIRVGGTAGTITIGGSVLGDPTHLAYLQVTGSGTTGAVNDIKTLTIKGNVQSASILAGYDASYLPGNLDSGFGSIKIGGNLTGSYITFGSTKGPDGIPGNSDDLPAATSLATAGSIKIGGAFSGLPGNTTRFYIEGPNIKKLTVGKATYLQAGLNGGGISFDAIGSAAASSYI